MSWLGTDDTWIVTQLLGTAMAAGPEWEADFWSETWRVVRTVLPDAGSIPESQALALVSHATTRTLMASIEVLDEAAERADEFDRSVQSGSGLLLDVLQLPVVGELLGNATIGALFPADSVEKLYSGTADEQTEIALDVGAVVMATHFAQNGDDAPILQIASLAGTPNWREAVQKTFNDKPYGEALAQQSDVVSVALAAWRQAGADDQKG